MDTHPRADGAIDRRSFLRGVAAAVAAGGSLGTAAAARGSGVPTAREIPLDRGWSFQGEYRPDEPLPGADAGETVDLPHCVVGLSWHGWDPAGWEREWLYQRTIDLPQDPRAHRVLLDFDGALSATSPTLNGTALPQTKGGYLPFSYEVTGLVHRGVNELAVVIDGRWAQIPPSGAPGGARSIDYLQPAGLSRHVGLRLVPAPAYVHDVFVSPAAPAAGAFDVAVQVTVDSSVAVRGVELEVALVPRGGGATLAHARTRADIAGGRHPVALSLRGVDGVRRWSPDAPTLYEVVVSLRVPGAADHVVSATTGFRDARFGADGFFLNGERLILFGLNRHQLFPYMGMSAPDRLQRRDAQILKAELNVNAVRCSHYPQSPAFLDACDELGMIVWEETPGWGYIGDSAWQQLWFGNVATMVARDRNRPSVVIWGVQPNETQPAVVQARRARAIADALDGTRPTAGTNTQYDWPGYVQPVFAYDDYHHNRPALALWGAVPERVQPGVAEAVRARAPQQSPPPPQGPQQPPPQPPPPQQSPADASPGAERTRPGYVLPAVVDTHGTSVDGQVAPTLRPPIRGTPYLVTEAVGALGVIHYFVRNGAQSAQQTQAIDHGLVHSQAQDASRTYAGLLGWAGFDYPSLHGYVIDGLKTAGVVDGFRVPKPGAAIYQSQIDPSIRPVIALAFCWYFGADAPVTSLRDGGLVCSNCEEVRAYLGGEALGRLSRPGGFAHLRHPPFSLRTSGRRAADLRLDGYVGGRRVISRQFSANTAHDALRVTADDAQIVGDGSDATRIAFVAVDRFGNLRGYVGGQVSLALQGPGQLIGENPFDYSVAGGAGAVWLRSVAGQYGAARVRASHPTLGSGVATVNIVSA